ncbi:MAG: Pseudouridine synthase [Chthoniobacteraceae bacterium]|nr:Pseudouridine synthase [Chthoniobacteraceae bacterium]
MPKNCTVQQPAELLAYLFASWPEVKRKQVRTWLKFQAILVNGRPVTQFDHPLRLGDVIEVRADQFGAARAGLGLGLKVHFEDPSVIVIDKPENLLSVATEAEQEKTAFFQLTEYVRRGKEDGVQRVWSVHRLDRDTSGLMVFAKTSAAATTLQAGWEKAEKHYEAVIEGNLPAQSGVFESYLDETHPFRVFSALPSSLTRHALTRYRVLARTKNRMLLDLTLETGRRNQIRVHLADAGCPVVGDKKYGAKTDPAKRLALHACGLKFPHPVTGEMLSFESPLPKDLARLVESRAPARGDSR